MAIGVEQGFSILRADDESLLCNGTETLTFDVSTPFECVEESYFFLGMLFVLMAVFVLVLGVFSMVVFITDAEEVYQSISF
jgi:hypothetical protein